MGKLRQGLLSLAGIGATVAVSLQPQPVNAQAAYGSYIGVGATAGLTVDENSDGRQLGGMIGVRYKFLKLPISLRVQGLFGAGTAVVPTVSYDFPLNWHTDLYLGAGFAFGSGEDPSPVGDTLSLAIQPGIDYIVPDSDLVYFGNAIFAFDAYRDGGGTAVSVQGGVGLKF